MYYGLAKKVNRRLRFYLNYYARQRTPVIVYGMGRVGSLSLYHSLLDHGVLVFHSHLLERTNLNTAKRNAKDRANLFQKYDRNSWWIYQHIICRRKHAKIISLVRHPVEKMLSGFANRLSHQLGYEKLSAQLLCDQFTTGDFDRERYLYMLHWFRDEFERALGIDVYKYPFDKNSGYTRFDEGPYDVLILRSELDDVAKSQLVAEFLGLDGFHIERANMAEAEPYRNVYRKFKQQVSIDGRHMDVIINSEYAQHFFPDEMLTAMNERFRSPGS